MSKSLIEELEQASPVISKQKVEKKRFPTKEEFDRPLFISKYTNLLEMERHYLRSVEKRKGSMRANQAHYLVVPSLDNEHT